MAHRPPRPPHKRCRSPPPVSSSAPPVASTVLLGSAHRPPCLPATPPSPAGIAAQNAREMREREQDESWKRGRKGVRGEKLTCGYHRLFLKKIPTRLPHVHHVGRKPLQNRGGNSSEFKSLGCEISSIRVYGIIRSTTIVQGVIRAFSYMWLLVLKLIFLDVAFL